MYDLDSPNHKSHMAYLSNVNGGTCPESHPIRLVSIFFEIIRDVNPWADQWWTPDGVGHPFVLSNGDPTGYGLYVPVPSIYPPLDRPAPFDQTNKAVDSDGPG